MNHPRVNEFGEIDIDSVNALSRTDLAQWIRERLQGRDLALPSDARNGQMPHYLLSVVYSKLSREVREDFQYVVLDFVRDVVRREDSSWQGEPADELFMLLNSLLPYLSTKASALELLLEIAEVGNNFPGDPRTDLRFRALQGIVSLRHRTDADFWLRQLREGGERYYPVFLEGLSLVGISVFFRTLEGMEWTKRLSEALLAILPNLLEEYGPGKVLMAIEDSLPRFAPEARRTLTEFLQEEQLLPEDKSVSAPDNRVWARTPEPSYGWQKTALVLDLELPTQTESTYLPLLHKLGLKTSVASNAQDALAFIDQSSIDLVIADLDLPEMNGLELLRQIRDFRPDIPVVVLGPHASVEPTLRALQQGALDFIAKPFRTDELMNHIKRALDVRDLQREREHLLQPPHGRPGFREIVGISEKMQDVFLAIHKATAVDSSVMLVGETGTGKGLIAHQIHAGSSRKDQPFIVMNCAALPSDLLESELFGHEKGAFTGATVRKIGTFERADGGTIFLDEVGELPPDTQVALLRVLHQREFERVEGTQSIKLDVRVIAATSRDLKEAVRTRRFREDLYFRLNVLNITVPPLRERKADIPLLVAAFIERFSRVIDVGTKISEDAMKCLLSYDWPGNVRELQNAIERAVILASGSAITSAHLPLKLQSSISELAETSEILPLEEVERRMIMRTLEMTHGDKPAAAKRLGIARKELSEKMKRFGLKATDIQ